MATGKTIFVVNGPVGKAIPSSISPSQKLLATTTMASSTELTLWNIETGKKLKQLKSVKEVNKFRNPITNVAFSQDSKKVITLSIDGQLIIWDVESGKELKKIPSKEAMLQELLKLP